MVTEFYEKSNHRKFYEIEYQMKDVNNHLEKIQVLSTKFSKIIYGSSININAIDYTQVKREVQNGVVGFQESIVKQYFKQVIEVNNAVSIDSSIVSGMPTIRNTRIPVSLIIANFRDQVGFKEIMKDYNLSEDEIAKSLDFVIELLERPYFEEEDF